MTKSQHTPTPWKLIPHDAGDKELNIDPAGVTVYYDDCDHDEQLANAALIVKAVNEREGLIAYGKAAVSAFNVLQDDLQDKLSWERALNAFANLSAALAKAEAE